MTRRGQPGADEHGSRGLAVALLGSLRVWVDGRPVELTAGRLRALLAVLAMSAGQTVSLDRLVAAMWDGELPADARRTVQTYVTRLRGLLGAGVVDTRPAGYALCAEPDRIDALRFQRLLDAAGAQPDASAERGMLAQALALWRGAPFEGVRSAWLEDTEAAPLVERYLVAVERWADLELAGGRAGELVGVLRELVGRYPLRESLWVRLLVALQRGGRQAEALEGYEAVRVRLAEELGADPGPDLRRVHADLLAGRMPETASGGGAGRPGRPVPRQLPAGSRGFTGRRPALALLDRLLGDAESARPATPIAAIVGAAGVGKTALAVAWAHRFADRFDDGQLYVDLHGATAGLRPLEPLEVLGRFLRALGTDPAAVPAELEEASGMFRAQVAGRRLLMVLDNAAGADQVVPLLPGSASCAVLVTSRQALGTLDGATQLHLDVLEPDEALELLSRLAGGARVAAEREAAAEVARWCGYLPLALRIAGARLATRPSWPVSALAGRLADAQRRLNELALSDLGVRASFTVSHQQLHTNDQPLDRAAAAAFAALGVLDGSDLGLPVVARLLDTPETDAQRVLERLIDVHLLETTSPGRYRMHDLLRLYARELAGRPAGEPDLAAALDRALGYYVATAWNTLALLRPGDPRLAHVDGRWSKGGLEFADDLAALAWLDAERANLLAAVQQAATTPGVAAEMAVQLAQALLGFFLVRGHWADWVQVNRTATRVAGRTGDRAAAAQAHNDLGTGLIRLGRAAEALACLQESLAIRRELGDRRGEAASLGNLGLIYEWQRRPEEALAATRACLAIFRELGDRRGQATSLGSLGGVLERMERYGEALASLQESLAVFRELGDREAQATTLGRLGGVHECMGRYEEALACQRESLAISRELGDRDGQAYSLNYLGTVYLRQGRHEEALAHHRESLTLRQELGDAHGQAESLRDLGLTLLALGRADQARAHWRQALAIFEQLQSADAEEIRALLADQPAR